MGSEFHDPWVDTLRGPWTAKMEPDQRPCHYCRKPAAMTEPGKIWKAHKVCALNIPSEGPLGNWDGEEHKMVADGPYGCGNAGSPVVMGRRCGENGSEPACRICPLSPTYWQAGTTS